jgi:hypothetical protein
MSTARAALIEAIEQADDAILAAENACDNAREAIHALRSLIAKGATDPDGPDPTAERKALAEWNRISGRTEAQA